MTDSIKPSKGSEAAPSLTSLFRYAVVTFLVWRGSLFCFEFMAANLTPRMGVCHANWDVFSKEHYFWNGFFRWDSGWYRSVVIDDYRIKAKVSSNVAFFPLYPYLCRALGSVVGNPFVAALILSNAALVGAIFYLRRLGDLLYGSAVSERAVVFILIFPTSLFFSAFYTESLFLLLCTSSMFFYFSGEYWKCGVLGFLAMLTRSTGVVLFGALALDAAWRLYRKQERFSPSMLALLLIPAGLVAFMALLEHKVGDPWAFATVMQHWGRHTTWPWAPLIRALTKTDWSFNPDFQNMQNLVDVASALGFIAIALCMAYERHRVALWTFVLLGVLMPLSTALVTSMNRYVLILFPAFFSLAAWAGKRVTVERSWIYASSFFLCLYATRFFQCGWAG